MTIILVSRFIAATNAPTTTRRNTATEPSFKPKRLDSFLRNEDPSLRLQPDLRTLLALVLPSRVLSMSKVSRSPFLMLSGSMPADCSALTKQTRGRFLVLAGNLVREEDRPSQKTKTGGPTCKQGSDRPGVAAAPPASPEPASATIIWTPPSRKISGVILMQMLPFADNKCLRTFAAHESGVCALLDAVQRAA
jgi:hypothetical protein